MPEGSNGGHSFNYGCSVVFDTRDPAAGRRYKMSYFDWSFDRGQELPGLSVAFSPDGVHWRKYPKAPLLRASCGTQDDPLPYGDQHGPWTAPLAMSDAHDAIYDPPRSSFAMCGKMWIDGPRGRLYWKPGMGHAESKDFIHWSKPQLLLTPNEFVAREVAKDKKSRGQLIISPQQDPEEVRELVKKFNFAGLKVCHTFADHSPTWDADVRDFLREEHVRIAHEEGLSITLHMVKARAIADPANQQEIRYYCDKYPNIKMILAHAARGFNPFHAIAGISALTGLRNVWCDASAVTEAGGFEAIVETLGHDRLLWGWDYPVSHLRGRCVAIGDGFVRLYEDTLGWDTIAQQGRICPLFTGHESLRALKLAARRLRLSDSQIEDIFCNNALRMLGI